MTIQTNQNNFDLDREVAFLDTVEAEQRRKLVDVNCKECEREMPLDGQPCLECGWESFANIAVLRKRTKYGDDERQRDYFEKGPIKEWEKEYTKSGQKPKPKKKWRYYEENPLPIRKPNRKVLADLGEDFLEEKGIIPDPYEIMPEVPRMVHVGNGRDMEGNFDHCGSAKRSFKNAIEHAYIQLNGTDNDAASFSWIVHDVDNLYVARKAIRFKLIPEPTFTVVSLDHGRAHMGYLLKTQIYDYKSDNPLVEARKFKAIQYYKDVIDKQAYILQSDKGFNQRSRVRNPFYKKESTIYGEPILIKWNANPVGRTLSELLPAKNVIQLYYEDYKKERDKSKVERLSNEEIEAEIEKHHRNATLFKMGLQYAEVICWRVRKCGGFEGEAIIPMIAMDLEDFLHEKNLGGLPDSEVMSIHKSIIKYASRWTHSKRRAGIVKAAIRGGIASGKIRREKAEPRNALIRELSADGLSKSAIARNVGVSRQTVHKVLAAQ